MTFGIFRFLPCPRIIDSTAWLFPSKPLSQRFGKPRKVLISGIHDTGPRRSGETTKTFSVPGASAGAPSPSVTSTTIGRKPMDMWHPEPGAATNGIFRIHRIPALVPTFFQ